MADELEEALSRAIISTLQEFKPILRQAALKATKSASDKFYKRTVDLLNEYYANYSPSSYHRTYTLQKSFVPVIRIRNLNKGSMECTAGIAFDDTKIDGEYSGSKKYQPTDGAWVIENFLTGEHPGTSGISVPFDDLTEEQRNAAYKNYKNYKNRHKQGFMPRPLITGNIPTWEREFQEEVQTDFYKAILSKLK